MYLPDKNTILSIVGPTGSGKTALTARYARALLEHGEHVSVISLDSRQIYIEFPHLSVADLDTWQSLTHEFPESFTIYNLARLHLHEDWSFGVLLHDARNQALTAHARGDRIILSGGTLICHQRFLELADDDTAIPPDDNVRFAAENMSLAELQAWLQKLDANAFHQLNDSDRANPRRLVRHIEITLARRLGTANQVHTDYTGLNDLHQVFCQTSIDRDTWHKQITARVETRFHDSHCRQEVSQVLADWPEILQTPKLLSRTPLGFSELAGVLQGTLDPANALGHWQTAEWHYAKRQLTLLRQLITDHHAHLIDQGEILADNTPVSL